MLSSDAKNDPQRFRLVGKKRFAAIGFACRFSVRRALVRKTVPTVQLSAHPYKILNVGFLESNDCPAIAGKGWNMLRAQTDWHLTARYIYALGLDGPSWAWEWLRRNRAYQTDWKRAGQGRRRSRFLEATRRPSKDRAAPWGLIALENPETPAHDAAVFWQQDSITSLLRAGARPHPDDHVAPYDIWSEPGRKAIAFDGDEAQLLIRTARADHRLLFDEPADIVDRIPLELRLDAPDGDRRQFDAARQFLFERSRERSPSLPIHPRAPLMMQMLQTVDGRASGASRREVAQVLFGADTVAAEWNVSERLKARVRYLEKRGRFFVEGGYRQLLELPKSLIGSALQMR
ncbi:MAG: DUF2285 domain-containing protein [Roseitalea porphyridii]|uniref:DUF2285 domain-containing protein n=1 Tax=Roseitalea porphyridii TaxID=1852022 RepID=UPI0032EDE63B